MPDDVRIVSTVTSHLQADLDAPWDRRRFARQGGCSVDAVEEIFQRGVGCLPEVYHQRLRLERAAYALAHTDARLDPVARRAGFDDVETFRAAFRDALGHEPGSPSPGIDAAPVPRDPPTDGAPPGLSALPRIVHVPAATAWTVLLPGASALHVAAGLWRLARAPGPPVAPYTLGVMALPWEGPPPNDGLRCLRLVPEGSPTPADTIRPLALDPTWTAVFDFEGPPTGAEAAFTWIIARWVPESGLRLAYAPVYSLTRGVPDWRGRIAARLHVGLRPLS